MSPVAHDFARSNAMIPAEDLSRTSAAIAASIALHAIVLAIAHRSPVVLTLRPTPMIVLVSASNRTQGPGERSPALRSAPSPGESSATGARSSAPVRAELPPAAPDVRAAKAPPRLAAPATPAPTEKVSKTGASAASERDTAKQKAAAREHAVVQPDKAPATPAADASRSAAAASPEVVAGSGHASGNEIAGVSGGRDAASSAPEWAPAARARYEELLFAWIDRHKQYPLLAQRRGLEGAAAVRIRIDRSGRVLERTLVGSTGQPLLDQAALDLVRRASPFPAVPREYAGSSFEFVAPVEYRLR
jgi:periplasmic protein TonB